MLYLPSHVSKEPTSLCGTMANSIKPDLSLNAILNVFS